MTNELFPVFRVDPNLFSDYPMERDGAEDSAENSRRFPPSRERALVRALQQKGIFVGSVPEMPQVFQFKKFGRMILHEDWPTAGLLKRLEDWEDSALGRPFASTVLPQGDAVRRALSPALHSNKILYVVDPYMMPTHWSDSEQSWKLATENVQFTLRPNITVFQAVAGITERPLRLNGSDGDWERHRLLSISEWVRSYAKVGRVSISIFLFSGRSEIHDRFLGLSNRLEDHSSWHAVSLGYGMSSLSNRHRNVTCLARIGSDHFSNVWEHAYRQTTWAIILDADAQAPGDDWIEDQFYRVSPVRIFKRRLCT